MISFYWKCVSLSVMPDFLWPHDLPNPGTEPGFPTLQSDSLPTQLPGKTKFLLDAFIYFVQEANT